MYRVLVRYKVLLVQVDVMLDTGRMCYLRYGAHSDRLRDALSVLARRLTITSLHYLPVTSLHCLPVTSLHCSME